MRKFAAYFKNFRPVLSFDSISDQPELSVKIETETSEKSLHEVFSYLQQIDKRCYIAIDEFQQIATYPEKNTEPLLRTIFQNLKNIRFVFCGSNKHLMNEVFNKSKRRRVRNRNKK